MLFTHFSFLRKDELLQLSYTHINSKLLHANDIIDNSNPIYSWQQASNAYKAYNTQHSITDMFS